MYRKIRIRWSSTETLKKWLLLLRAARKKEGEERVPGEYYGCFQLSREIDDIERELARRMIDNTYSEALKDAPP